jgi:hypothetical protein
VTPAHTRTMAWLRARNWRTVIRRRRSGRAREARAR